MPTHSYLHFALIKTNLVFTGGC